MTLVNKKKKDFVVVLNITLAPVVSGGGGSLRCNLSKVAP